MEFHIVGEISSMSQPFHHMNYHYHNKVPYLL